MIRYFGLFSLLLIFGFTPVFGEIEDFSMNQSVFHKDDQLIVSGTLSYVPEIPFVTIQIFTPGKSNFADFNTVPANPNGSFSASFHVGGPTWTSYGTYPIKVTYGGSLEKSIEFRESNLPEQETSSESKSQPESTPESKPKQNPQTQQQKSQPKPKESFSTLKLKIPNFPAFDKSPQYYIDRYNAESNYKSWFDSQFPSNSIEEVVGYSATHVDGFPAFDKSPQYYIDRYNAESNYKSWFDSQFPNESIYNVLGYDNPVSVPDWIRTNAEWWATGEITDSMFVSGIEYMLENNIIMISNIPPSRDVLENDIPNWIRNNAHWWSQDLISEDEFVNSLKFLIQEGIIKVN